MSPMSLRPDRKLRFIVALVALLLSFGPMPVTFAADAPVLYLSPTGDDRSGTGSKSSPYQTIGRALGEATPGATIILLPGTYRTTIGIEKQLTIESDPEVANAAASTIIDATGQSHGVWIHGSGAAGAVVRGLTVRNANDGAIIVADTSDVLVENNQVTNNALHPGPAPAEYAIMAESKAIQLQGTRGAVVRDNRVTANWHGGIAMLDSPANPGVNNQVVGNQIVGNQGDCGVVLAAYVPGKGIQANVVEQNTVRNNVAGIVVAADPEGTSAVDNVVTGNLIEGNQLPGVIVHSNAPNQVVSGTVVSNNTIRRNGADPGVNLKDTAGIAIIGAYVPVTNTTVRNNTITDERVPVWQYDPPPQLGPSAGPSLTNNRQLLLTIAGIAAVLVLIGAGAVVRRAN
ncbi:MAG TPA: right-handed parallel beta-helix repeat-containing protein [Chloroflexota bacterium]|nr:right-handed parallel beta-helix repeat-containing protein [Chloroflexota bacterium]